MALSGAQQQSSLTPNDLALLGQDVIHNLPDGMTREEGHARAVTLHALAVERKHCFEALNAKPLLAIFSKPMQTVGPWWCLLDFGEFGSRLIREVVIRGVRRCAFLNTDAVAPGKHDCAGEVAINAAAGGTRFTV